MNPLLKILPPIWYFILLFAALALHFYVPVSQVFDVSYPVIGIGLLVIGQGLSMYASSLFAAAKTEILPTSATNSVLIIKGPYAYSRNPMYLGMVISLLGIAIWAGSLPFFVAALLDFCVLNFVFIPFEETKLARIFGSQFEEYRHKVRRWI